LYLILYYFFHHNYEDGINQAFFRLPATPSSWWQKKGIKLTQEEKLLANHFKKG